MHVSLRQRIGARIAALLGIAAYTAAQTLDDLSLESERVEELRRAMGGQLQPLTITRTRWYLKDIETAEVMADGGDLSYAAQLMRAARKDGQYAGVLSTRTDGLVRLPKRFRGRQEIVDALELGHDETRSVFDEMFPPAELALLAADGIECGVGVGELVPVEGRDYPVLVRLSPEFLTYRWSENRWYFRSIAGLIPITPGDGRWVLHVPGGRMSPWQSGLWRAIGRAYVRKEHASLHRDAWEAKLAHPARVAVAPQGAAEPQKQSWFRKVMGWGVNTVFGLSPGYDVKLLESNGRGADSFRLTIAEQNDEFKMAVAGQLVTSDGGAGFQNSDIHRTIRADLIKSTADALAYTLNTQGIPPYVLARWGENALAESAIVQWDVEPAKDRAAEATAYVQTGTAIKVLDEALAPHGKRTNVREIADRYGIPIEDGAVDVAEEAAKPTPLKVAA